VIRSLLGKFWLICAGLVILFAVLLSIARLLLPHVDRYHDEIEQWLSSAVGQPVVIGAIAAEWHGLGPRLRLTDVSLVGDDRRVPIARFAAVAVDIDLPASIVSRVPRIDRLMLVGVSFTVERDAEGNVTVAGHGLPQMSPGDQPVRAAEPGRLTRWMLAQGHLAIEDASITWIDHRAGDGGAQVFSGVRLELRNDLARHQVNGSVDLPDALGEDIAIAADFTGDPLGSDWRAQVYLQASGLDLGRWLDGRDAGGIHIEQGRADAALWADLGPRRIDRVDGRISGSRIALRPAPPPADRVETGDRTPRVPQVIDGISADFSWRAAADGWRVDVGSLTFMQDDLAGPAASIALEWREDDRGVRRIAARAESVQIGEIAKLMLASSLTAERLHSALARTNPEGLLTALDLRYAGSEGEDRYAVRAAVEAVDSDPWSGIPGVTNVSGLLVLDQDSGRFDIDTGAAGIDFGDLFRDALPIAEARGRFAWRRHEGGWRVQVPRLDVENEDLTLTAWGRLDLPPGEAPPAIALFAHFEARTVERTSRYLPVRIMPPATVGWLDRAILGGASPRGDLVFHGPLKGFPFNGGTGRFKVDFDVEDGVLEYSPHWPSIGGIDAHIVFEGRRMDIAASDGRSLSSRVLRADVEIPDLREKPAILRVDGHAQGETLDALRYLRETPLAERFGALARDADATGSSTLDLKLSIPLDGSPARIDGDLYFTDSTLMLVDDTIDITQINGHLNFTETGVSAAGIDARILGLPALVTVKPRLEDGSPGALVEAGGSADGPAIAELIDLAPLRHVEGETAWRASLRVPFGDDRADERASLRIESDLTGLAIRLPEPLNKAAGTALPLKIGIPLPREPDLPVHFRLGDILAGVFTLDDANAIERGELRFGGGEVSLPVQPGLRISGSTRYFAYDPWATVFAGRDDRAGAAGGLVNAIDLQAGQALLFGREFNAIHIDARRNADIWTADVSAVEIAGRIVVPLEAGRPWRADLRHLHLAVLGANGDPDKAVDPRTLPPMRIESERFSYGDTDYGTLSLVSSQRPAGVHMDRLLLISPQARIDARGDWVVAGERQYSSFNIGFETGDFGAALANFGYADTIRGGKGNAVVTARWHGPPTAFALDRLDGSLELSISNGRLLDVEPGAGRIFGLVSLQALPRRLTLDFSDFFGRGFSFDRISGSFAIKDGVATTDNLVMNGPAAKVEASGMINLAARQYDQIVVVYPNVSSGLPVAGVVAGGVGVGAAILLMERIFKPDIERMTKITYQVRGPWSEPEIHRLQDGVQSGKR
jgi:uncharacterized protein (TIGR02099 family)